MKLPLTADQIPTFVASYLRQAASVRGAQSPPSPTSRARVEETECGSPEPLSSIRTQTSTLLESAVDHMLGFVRTVAPPALSMVPWTCARGAIEAASQADWLLDLKITSRSRVERSLTLRADDLGKQLKLANGQKDKVDAARVRQRLVDLEALARTLGVAPKRDKNGQLIGVGISMPTATNLIVRLLGHEFAYRGPSGVAHGTVSALLQACHETDPLTETPKKTVHPEVLYLLSAWQTEALARALWSEFGFYGWDCAALAAQFEHAYDALDIKDELRFWR